MAGLPVVLHEVKGAQVSSFLYPLGSTTPIFQSDSASPPLWYHSDGLGSVRTLTDGSGSIVNTSNYGAFGTNAGETGKADNDHAFAGEQLDPTGLYFNRARYYNPQMGRFISRDSEFGDTLTPQSLHHYSYAWNNPTVRTDPSGYSPSAFIPEMKLLESIYGVQFYSNYRLYSKGRGVINKFNETCTNAVSSGCSWFDLNDAQLADALDQTVKALEKYVEAFGTLANFKSHLGRIILKFIPKSDPDSEPNTGVADVWGNTVNIKMGNTNV